MLDPAYYYHRRITVAATKKAPSEDPLDRLQEDSRKLARLQLYIVSGLTLAMLLYPWLFL